MKLKYARHVLNTISSGVMGVGALWISGYLDEAHEALKVVKRASKRNAKRKKAKR